MNYTKLAIFDLDDTLIRPPLFTHMKELEMRFMDLKFSSIYDFYDHPISLDPKLYDILAIEPVLESAKAAYSADDTLSCLITHRSKHLSGQVETVLRGKGLALDNYFYLGRVTHKYQTIESIMLDNPEIEQIDIYEDSFIQIYDYYSNLKLDGVNINYWFVDKTRVFKLDSVPTISNKEHIKLV